MHTVRKPLTVLVVLVLGGLLTGCGAEDPAEDAAMDDTGNADPDALSIGSGNFPESVLLATLYAEALEAEGVEVAREFNIGTREIYFSALQQGDLDLVPEYLGSLHNHLTGGDDEITEADDLLADLREQVAGEITLLDYAEAENKNAHLVRPETAEEYGLETLSDLGEVSGELVGGGPPEARERPDGLPGLKEVYDIEFAEYRDLDAGGPLTIEALSQGDIDVARAYSTLGVIRDRGWINLEDDQQLLNAENIVPAVRDDALTEDIETALDDISNALTTEDLIEMNARVEVDNEDPELVAEDWLAENELLD